MHEHEKYAPPNLKFGIVVVSDAVYEGRREDVSGPLAKQLIEASGNSVSYFARIPNDRRAIEDTLMEALESDVDILIYVGGTGLGPNDLTVDVIKGLSDKEVPGFGELFRFMTFQTKGPTAILSRAGMWIVRRLPVVVTPGSPDAVETALKLIIPVAGHLVVEVRGLRHAVRQGV